MSVEKFSKEKVQVEYSVKFNFSEDAKALKPFKDDADKLIKLVQKENEWGFSGVIKASKKGPEVDRIKAIGYPQIRNGHKGESGHDWQWQLDTESMGKGSKDRLYLDSVKATISKQKVKDKTVKVGKDEYTVIDCEVTLTGKFSAETKH